MKAHRRKGIPTLMLQTGGSTNVMLGPRLGRPLGRGLLPESQEEQRQNAPDTETQLARDIRRVGKIIDPAIAIPRGIMGLARGYNKFIGRPFAEYARTEVPTPAAIERAAEQSAQTEAEAQANAQANAQADLARTQAQRAADALSGGVRRPPTTPVEKAKAAQADQAAETAKASQAAASVSSPEEEALRQATGATSRAAEATAAAKSGDPSREASPVQGKDGTTIADIMGGPAAVFNEKERLNELKTTFGLNLSDMEKAAPGIAFSLSLMGAQRAPGESVFNALARSAGSAGQGALKAKLALDAKERAIDSSLVSTVLGEKKVAEDYVKKTMWTAVWDGGFNKNGIATASFYRMNERQQSDAIAAGIPIVPTEFLGNAMTVVGARARAGATAGAALTKEVRALAAPTKVKIDIAGQSVDAFSYTSPGGTRFTLPADVSAATNNLNANLNGSAMNMQLTAGLKAAVNSDNVAGLANVFEGLLGKGQSLIFGFTPTEEMSPLDMARKLNSGATGAFNAAKVNAALAAMDPNKISQGLSTDELKKIYGEEAVEARDKGDTNALNKIISSKTPKLTNIVGLPEAQGRLEEKGAYETRIYYKAVQNALAAQLAPILLGESGRTISDADRVRVTTLLGGFADYSRAGAGTTKQEMLESIGQLERILGKYAEKAEGEAKSFMGNIEQAMRTPSFNPLLGNIFTPTDADRKNLEMLASSYAEFPEDLKRAGSQTPPPTNNTPTFNATDVLPGSQ